MDRSNVFYPHPGSSLRAHRSSDGLSLTEWVIVFFTGLSGLVLADPFYGGRLARSYVSKVLLFGSLTVALGINLIARATISPSKFGASTRRVFSSFWPLMLLAVFVIAGSMWGVRIEKVKSPFLSMGLSMLLLPALAISVDSSDRPMAFLKCLAVAYVATVLMMLVEMPFNRKSTHHEEIFLAIPLCLIFLSARHKTTFQIAMGALLLVACGLSIKNTTYIMMLLVLSVSLFVWMRKMSAVGDPLRAFVYSLVAVLFVVGVLVVVAVIWYTYKHLLPHGNTEYREEMYRIAWEKFVASPIWGTGFAGEAVSYFSLYKVDMATQYLPTHSDILDILANGGLIGFFFWLATVLKVPVAFWDAVKKLSQPLQVANEIAWRWLLVLSVGQMCAIVTYAVNPPLINPLHGYWVWGGLAATWALRRQLTIQEEGKVKTRISVA